jgi:NADH:ubiquinone oxidoreductase subunit H
MQTLLNLLEVEPIRLLISFGAVLFLVLNLAAILTMAERKVSGYIHLRYGPNRVGPRGLLQPAHALAAEAHVRAKDPPQLLDGLLGQTGLTF